MKRGWLALVAIVALLGLVWFGVPRPSTPAVVEAPAPEPKGPAIPPVLGEACRIEGTVVGGAISTVIVQSLRAQLDLEATVEGDRFTALVPEQGPMLIVAIAVDGRTATLSRACGGDGVLVVRLELPAVDPSAGTLTGLCLYLETGAPVPGAVVRSTLDAGDAEQVMRSAVTDAKGEYRIALPAGSFLVRCAKDADDGAPREVEIDARTVTRADLFLEGRAGVAGVVLLDNKPVQGAILRGRAAREGIASVVATGQSDAKGRFLLNGFQPGAVIVEAQLGERFAEGHALAQVALPYAELRLELGDSVDRAFGIVLGSDGGPIDGAKIEVTSTERGLRLHRATLSGPGGDYVLAGLVPGRYLLEAHAEGHQSAKVELAVVGPTRSDLRLEAACQSKLRVLPAVPPRPVRVVIKKDDRWLTDLAGLTGDELIVPGQSGKVELLARTVGSPVRTATLAVDLCASPSIVLSLEDKKGTGDLEVTVKDKQGRPVPKADVWRAGSGFVRTGADGIVRFEGLEPSSYMVGARDARPQRVDVRAGELAKVELLVDRGGGSVRGRVVASGLPVEGARILAVCADSGRTPGLEEAPVMARSDPEGEFEFAPDGGSVCRVRAEHPGKGRSRAVTLRAGGDPGLLELASGASITGRVVAAVTRDPVVPCSVSLSALTGASEVEGRTTFVSTPDGRFKFEDVTPGRIALAVVGASGRGRIELELSPAEQKEGVELLVFKRGRVIGKIADAERRPIGLVEVAIRAGSRTLGRVSTGPDGRFDLEVDAGEPLQVYASKKGYYPKGTLPFDLLPGLPTDIGELVLDPRGAPEEKEGGIGLMFRAEENGIRVIDFIPDSPAREAGIVKGDVISAIDHTPFGREPMVNWLFHLRGRPGTTVILEIERGTEAPFNVPVIRRAVGLPPMPEDADL